MRACVIRHIGSLRLGVLLGLAITCAAAAAGDEAPAPSPAPAASTSQDTSSSPAQSQPAASAAPGNPAPEQSEAVYAMVNGQAVSMQEYIQQLATTLRKRF